MQAGDTRAGYRPIEYGPRADDPVPVSVSEPSHRQGLSSKGEAHAPVIGAKGRYGGVVTGTELKQAPLQYNYNHDYHATAGDGRKSSHTDMATFARARSQPT